MKHILLPFTFIIMGFLSLQAQEWHNDINNVREEATTKDRPVILVFKGSDWCAPCIKLDRYVFKTETFRLYAKDHFVLLEADFPRRKKNALPEQQQEKNNALAEKYNPRGIFPFVVILNGEGKVLGETGYFKATPNEYILHLKSFKG